MMKFAMLVLLLLAGAKVWTHEQIYRSATEDALLEAYRAQAIATCRAATAQEGTADRRQIAAAFAKPARAHLQIGNPDVSVAVWDVDHAAWAMRYTYPYVVLETAGNTARCTYDVKLGRARITLL